MYRTYEVWRRILRRGSARNSVCSTNQLAGCVALTCYRRHGVSSHPISRTEGGIPLCSGSQHSLEYLKSARNFTQQPHQQLLHCSSPFVCLMGKQALSFITSPWQVLHCWGIAQRQNTVVSKLFISRTPSTRKLLPEVGGYSHISYKPTCREISLNHHCTVSTPNTLSCLSTPFPPIGSQDDVAWCDSILKKRRRKMNRHKYRKWRKKMRFLRRALGK